MNENPRTSSAWVYICIGLLLFAIAVATYMDGKPRGEILYAVVTGAAALTAVAVFLNLNAVSYKIAAGLIALSLAAFFAFFVIDVPNFDGGEENTPPTTPKPLPTTANPDPKCLKTVAVEDGDFYTLRRDAVENCLASSPTCEPLKIALCQNIVEPGERGFVDACISKVPSRLSDEDNNFLSILFAGKEGCEADSTLWRR